MQKFTPYEHQVEALEISRKKPNLALFWEMGTGKTAGTILILRDKYNIAKKLRRTLILGPVAVIYNWRKEILKYSKLKPEHVFVSEGAGEKRVSKLQSAIINLVSCEMSAERIVIMNYEGLRNKGIQSLLKEWKPEIVVCDESHLVKSHKAIKSKVTYELAKHAEHKIMLTGTPVLNSPKDIFMQYKILDNGATFGGNYNVFMGKYFKDENAHWRHGNPNYFPKLVPIPDKFPELTEKIYSKALRVLKEDCLDLPERIEQVYHVELASKQKKVYNDMKRDFIAYLDEVEKDGRPKAVVAQLALTKALRLQQIVCGFVKTEAGEIIPFDKNPRLEQAGDLIEQIVPNHKLILWCSFIENYKQLGNLCDKLGIKYVNIIGGTNAKQKQQAVDEFNDNPDVRIVIANRKAGGTGINLTAASYSITYSRNFSLAEELQSKDRNHRGGSEIHEKIVKIDLCAKGTIDELITDALTKKHDISQQIIDLRRKL